MQVVTGELADRLTDTQEKLNKLTKGYLNGLIDEDSYQVAKDELIVQKNALKKEKERLSKNRAAYWNEPAKAVISTLELTGKAQTSKSPQEISQVVQNIGTNRLIARKTVSFSFAEKYDFLPSLLGNLRIETSNPSLALSEENLGSPIWCSLVSALRTKCSKKSVLNEPEMTP
jgi:hypothetical protein